MFKIKYNVGKFSVANMSDDEKKKQFGHDINELIENYLHQDINVKW